MNQEVYTFAFNSNVDMDDVKESLYLSILATESLHSAAEVRLDVTFLVDDALHGCVIDASTAAGRTLCLVFTGYIVREFGDDFRVDRVQKSSWPAPTTPSPNPEMGAAA